MNPADLTLIQRRALGSLARKLWGTPPRSSKTWNSLQAHGLVTTAAAGGKRPLRLTANGRRLVKQINEMACPNCGSFEPARKLYVPAEDGRCGDPGRFHDGGPR